MQKAMDELKGGEKSGPEVCEAYNIPSETLFMRINIEKGNKDDWLIRAENDSPVTRERQYRILPIKSASPNKGAPYSLKEANTAINHQN